MNLTELAVKRPIATTMVFIALSVLGAVSYYLLPVQMLPNLVFPQLQMQVWMQGASPEELEETLVIPAEGAIATLEGVESIQTSIYSDRAEISISFEFGTDMTHAYINLEQMANALRKDMPEQSFLQIYRFDTSDFASVLMQLVVGGPGEIDRLRNVADETIVPALEAVDGIVNVQAYGGKEIAVEVIVDEEKCEALNVSVLDVARTIQVFNHRTEYLGDVRENGMRYFVSLSGQFASLADLRELRIASAVQVTLNDIAEIRFGRKDADRISRIDGKQAVMLVIRKDSMANMLRVAKNVYREIDRLNLELADEEVSIRIVMDSADQVASSILRVQKLALFGVALAMGVLLVFLKRLRTVSIVLIVIPVSLLITFNVMYFADLSINLVSLVGFAFAIGLLVDNSVVVIENTCRLGTRIDNGIEAAIRGTQEVVIPIIAMTGTTLMALLPVFFLEESEFKLIMAELVYAIGAPLIVSVFVSLTLVPMLAARTIVASIPTERRNNRFLELYVALLKAVLRRRGFAMVLTVVFFFFSIIVCLPVTLSLFEAAQSDDQIEYFIQFPNGTPIETASRLTAKLEEVYLAFPDVKMVQSTIDTEQARVIMEFFDVDERTTELDIGAIRRQIKKQVETIEGLGANRVKDAKEANQYNNQANTDSMQAMSSGGSSEHIEIRGEDAEMLEMIARQIQQRLGRAFENSMFRPFVASQPGDPELEIRGVRDIMAKWGLTMSDMANVVWFTRPGGDQQLVPFRAGDQDIDILVRLKDSKTRTIDDLERMRIRTSEGQYVDLREVSDIKVSETSRLITRRDQQHEIWVHYSFNPEFVRSAARLESLQGQVDEVIGDMQLPPGYSVKIVHDEQDNSPIFWTLIAAVICVFLLLAALFEDVGTPLCVMATLPLAVAGALWGLVFTQTGLINPMVGAGMVMLIGIVVNDAILTLGQSRLLLKKGYNRSRAVLEGGRNRFRPVMMTTATTVFAMLPLAIREGGDQEIWPPFAITVIFGLLASTFFTLGFIPAMYLSLEDIGRWLRSIHAWGLTIATSGTASLFYFGFMRAGWVESWAWRIILTPTVFFAMAAVIWFAIRTVTYVNRVSVFRDEDVHIRISNLTKHYGADGRFVRDLKFKERREAGKLERGEPIVVKKHITEDFIWKVPGYGLLIYFHFYFENPLWQFVLACATWLALYDLVRSCGMLLEGEIFLRMDQHPSKPRRLFWLAALRVPAVLWIVYFYWVLQAQLWIATLFLVIAMLLHWLSDLAKEARRTGIAPSTSQTLWGRLKRLAFRIPIIAGVKPQVHALTSVNLEIGKGMFGLLGPNGAGKTTLMRILCNIYEPTYGCIEINGRNIGKHRADVQPILGYLPQHFGSYENFTVWEYLTYFAMLNDIFDKEERETLTNKVISDVNLEDRKHDKISSLSGGMKQRVGIAQTLLHLPKIIVVDEPTAGLDPVERVRFRNLLAELGKDRIVVFSTHITEDVMSACHQLAVLNEGRVVFRGTPEELQRLADGKVYERVIEPSEVPGLLERVYVISQVTEAEGIRVRYLDASEVEPQGEIVEPTLEDGYVYLLRSAKEMA